LGLLVVAIENHRNREIEALCQTYLQRLTGKYKCELELLPAAKVTDPQTQQEKETAAIEKLAKPGDTLYLLDERGMRCDSVAFSQLLEQELDQSRGRIIFAIGGAYGFTDAARNRHKLLRMSDWVFPHQLARLVLMEQLYRASQIAKGTGYHHV
jgi:23S rRNA (pseudouridine1915-N3)-methyltransferase